MSKFAFVIALLSTLVRFGSSIRCFECNSANNSMCLDPTIYDLETVAKHLRTVTCDPRDTGGQVSKPEEMFCRKMVQTILHKNHDPLVRVSRGCGWVKHHRNCYKADNEDHLETVCQCFSDGCNAAAEHRHATVAFLIVISISALL